MSTHGNPVVVTALGGRRRARLAVAAWLAAIVAVVAWVAAAGIGSTPRNGGLAAAPSGSVEPSKAAPPSAAPPSAAPPSVGLVHGTPQSGTVWLRAGSNVRSVDLRTGRLSAPIGTGDWRDRILRRPDGEFLCVCTDVSTVDGGERVTVSLDSIDAGQPSISTALVTVEGAWDENQRRDEQGYPVTSTATLSPDGALVAIGLAVRRPPSWERSLLVVDAASREVVQVLELDPVPAETRVEAWAPRVTFSGDGARALVSLTVIRLNMVTDERHFAAWIHGQLLELEPVEGFGTKGDLADGRCIDAWPQLMGHDTAFAICRDASGFRPTLRSVSLETGRILELDLDPVLEGVYPMQLVDGASGILYLWDPFSHRAARIHVASAKLDSVTIIDAPTAALPPLEQLARSLSGWIAPPALAKILLEPGIALSADGRRLYVVAMSGDGISDPGEASMIHVLDAATLQRRASWTVEPDVVSIAIGPNGRDVVVGLLARAPEGMSPTAGVAVLDADTGAVLVRYDGLGTEWPLLVDAAALDR